MASEAQRKQREKLKAYQDQNEESGDIFGLGDLELEEADDLDTFERLTKLTKGPLHLLLMVRAPNFPFSEETMVYVRTQTGVMGEIRVLSDGRLRTKDEQVKESLSTAVWAYRPQHKSHPDGWEYAKVATAEPGRYQSLNQLFIDNWKAFDIELDTLLDNQKLAEHMVERGIASASESPVHQVFNRKASQSGKIKKKSNKASKDGTKK